MALEGWFDFIVRCFLWALMFGVVLGGVFYLFTNRPDVAAMMALILFGLTWPGFMWLLPRERKPSRFRSRTSRKP